MNILSYKQSLAYVSYGIILLFLTSCSSIVSSTAQKLADNLSYTILNSDDPQTVEDGAPAYLLLMDSFLVDSDNNPDLLQSAAILYSAYSSVFVTDKIRAIRLSKKALSYAEKALCLNDKNLCTLRQSSFELFSSQVNHIDHSNIQSWYIFGASWAAWIKANSGSMAAVAELPKVKLIMNKVAEIDDTWQNGQVHLYLGVLNTLLPPALGGKPELGQYHFKHAIEISGGNDLTAKVLYAEKYARLVFDQRLHDQLLNEVIDSDPFIENLTLMNIIAQEKAQDLLNSSSEYF